MNVLNQSIRKFNQLCAAPWLFALLFPVIVSFNLYAQPQIGSQWGDAEVAQQYANWAKQVMDEGRTSEALAALERAADFSNVSSDISYLLATARFREGKSRTSIIEPLDTAIEINRWVLFSESQALLLKAEQLIAMRRFSYALTVLDQIGQRVVTASISADAAMLRLLVFRGLATGFGQNALEMSLESSQALVSFRSILLSTMERYPRDPRPLRIFFEYARNRMPEISELTASDLNLLELALRRLPFLLEADPELAWLAAPFMRDTGDARRLVASYRAGGIPHIQNRDFRPHPGSISAALNLGLIDDREAVEELFPGSRGFNYPLPPGIAVDGNPVLEKDIIIDVFNLLRSEAGRDLFTQKLLSFSGIIISKDTNGFIESRTYYNSGFIREFDFDRNLNNLFDFRILFSASGVPVSAEYPVTGQPLTAAVFWERYPSVERTVLSQETFSFPPGGFQFAPVSFIMLGGSRNHTGITYPVLASQIELTRRTMVSFCVSITRPSIEFDGAIEQIFLDRGIPRQAVEILNGRQVSITEFERGIPIVQYVDLDLDGRMETVRRFHRPSSEYPWPDSDQTFDYRRLLASSESDWTGEGLYKTGELYLQDGSVVYLWDIDGSGVMNYSEYGIE
jgi:tetratricopeptide (TPR) repeat protein